MSNIINPNYGDAGHISTLAEDNLIQVFGNLSTEDLYVCSQVCSLWDRLSNDKCLSLFQGKKNEWKEGNECLRRGIEEFTIAFPNASTCPFADRIAIIEFLKNINDYWISGSAFRNVAAHGYLSACESLLPLMGGAFIQQGLGIAIQKGHVHIVKKLALIPRAAECMREMICIKVICDLKKGDSIYLRGQIGAGTYDLNSWDEGFPMKKAKESVNTWEIILLPIVYGENTFEYNPFVDRIFFEFKPVLHRADGEIRWANPNEGNYKIEPRTNMTITPKFDD